MTNTVQIKRSGVPGSTPAAGNLVAGELAINYADGSLFYKNSSNVVTIIASNQSVSVSGNITGGNVSVTGNITGGNVLTSGNIYTGAGNAGYVYGNAFYMSGISAAISVTKIENGNSNVWVRTPGGDVTVTAGGIANVALFSTGTLTLSGAIATPKTIHSNIVVAESVNGMLLGPLTFGDNVFLTVPTSSTVYIYAP